MSRPEYGETWVYEGIAGAIPGLDFDPRTAFVIQFVLFESAVLLLAWVYGLPLAAVVGTVAVVVATAGSAAMVSIARSVRGARVPEPYRRLLFGSNFEVVLAILAYVGFVTYLFVFDAQYGETSLLGTLFGEELPLPAVYLLLLIAWDVCYRISAAWWAGITALWRSIRFRVDDETRQRLLRADALTAGFGVLQLAFVPFLLDQPLLLAAFVGHVLAVLVVTTASITLLHRNTKGPTAAHP